MNNLSTAKGSRDWSAYNAAMIRCRMPSAGYIHLAIVYVVWGTVYPVIRVALIDANAPTPMQLQTGRLLLSAAVLAIPLMLRARFIIKSRRDLALCIVSGCLFWVTGNGFATLALRQLPAGFVTTWPRREFRCGLRHFNRFLTTEALHGCKWLPSHLAS